MLNVALPKGRLGDKVYELFASIGYDCSEIYADNRKLVFESEENNVRYLLVKPSDVVIYIARGAADIGVVGKDTIMEHGGKFFEVADLGFGKCKFALAVKKGVNFYDGYGVKTVATKYPEVTRRFFEAKGMDVDIVKIEGSVELAPLVGLADGIVDIVETGTTLKENGLEVYEYICPISARLIANMVSLKLRKEEIERLISAIEENIG